MTQPTLGAIVRARLTVPWSRAKELCETGRVFVNGTREYDASTRLDGSEAIEVRPNDPKQSWCALADDALLYADRDIAVVNKPIGVMTLPFDGTERDTLVHRARALLRKKGRGTGFDPELGVVHRLDKDTSGVLVFTRSLQAKRHLEAQFRVHAPKRTYLAIVHGHISPQTMESHIVPNRGDGLRGSWERMPRRGSSPPPDAQWSVTHVMPIEGHRTSTLVACQLETGRQHQIRIHLSEAGHPLVGEAVYIREYRRRAEAAPSALQIIAAPRPMLHALSLAFVHPRTEEEIAFRVDPPSDFTHTLERLST